MKIQDRTDTVEPRILAEMLGNPTVLGRISSKWDGNLFKSPWANVLAKLAIDFHRKHGQAPNKGITSLFEEWGRGKEDTENYELINNFLGTVDIPNGELNPELSLDLAGKHFNRVKAQKLIDDAQADLEADRIDRIYEKTAEFNRVELGVGAGIDVLTEESAVDSTFSQQEENLIQYPGNAGKFFQGALARDCFIAFEAAEKVGKTFWLLDIAWRAMLNRRKVAFFEVGDMSERQILRRFYSRAALHPFKSTNGWPYTVKYPVIITNTGGDIAEVKYQDRVFTEPLGPVKAKKALKRVLERKIKTKDSPLRLSTHPASTIDVAGIKSILDSWTLSGWCADVVVIDYADILMMPYGKMERRDKINETWTRLRALSQQLHCLVVTATQADADSYGKKILDRKNFSEDKRKHAHVSGMVGINVFGEEKNAGIMRLNWLMLREGEYSTSRCLHCACCLPLANPCVRSCF